MTDKDASEPVITKAQAQNRYNRHVVQAGCIRNEVEFFETFFLTALNILEAFYIFSSSGTIASVLLDCNEVCETMAKILPAPSYIYTDDYFKRSTYPFKVLFSISASCWFYETEFSFLSRLSLSPYEKMHKIITNQVGSDSYSARSPTPLGL